jgi:hypothetical protein
MPDHGRDKKDPFSKLVGWDVELGVYENRLRSVRAAALAAPTRAFLFNLRSIDNLLLSPFLIAADGVRQFYWTLKYVGAGNKRIVSVLKGEMPAADLKSGPDTKISEAEVSLREFLATPEGLQEFAEQIDTRLRSLVERKDFQIAMRVQLLSSVVLLWTAYETLRNDLQQVGKTYSIPSATITLAPADADQLNKLKEYRNVIVHKAGIVDNKFVARVGLHRPGETIDIDAEKASGFFDAVAKPCAQMLLAVNHYIESNPLTH